MFVNGQHDPASRPKPIARAYVDVTPDAPPAMDFLETFDDGAAWAPFTKWQDNNAFIYRNADWAIDTSGCTENFTFGPLLGQFVLGFADGGSSCNVSITPRKVPTKIAADTFLHVRDDRRTSRRRAGATRRSLVTNVPIQDDPPLDSMAVATTTCPVHARLGNFPYQVAGADMKLGTADDVPAEGGQSIVVQPFGGYQETQIEYCDTRGWGVGTSSATARNVYGFHAGDYMQTWKQPWLPVPTCRATSPGTTGPCSGTCTRRRRRAARLHGRQATSACAVLPAGPHAAPRPITVAYRCRHLSLRHRRDGPRRRATGHTYEHESTASATATATWTTSGSTSPRRRRRAGRVEVCPCGTKWYGGG